MYTYIKGHYSKSIFENGNGYYVGIFKISEVKDKSLSSYVGKTITFTGYFHELNNLDTYILYGEFITHDKYGRQFQVESYERARPEEKDAITEFLSSGLFKGLGKKKAKKIVDKFGKETLKIILDSPKQLIEISGITETYALSLQEYLKEYENSYDAIIYLTEKGFSTKDAMKIYNTYKKETIKIIEENIYKIIENVDDLYFKKVDIIALRSGEKLDSINRIKAAIIYIMEELTNTYGHCYFKKEEIEMFLPRVIALQISNELSNKALKELELELKIVIKDDKYYLKDMYDAECLIVKRFRSLNKSNNKIKDSSLKKLSKIIKELEENYNIKYNEEQKAAIIKSYTNNFLIITGGPGTGKTTIMKAITEVYREMNKCSYEKLIEKMALLAPTGRAAKRMSETSNLPASTIHRFLKWQKDSDYFQVNKYNKSKVEIVVIDEASMIDTYLMGHLLDGISANCRVILVGDDHQLPSVGPGEVLHDLIDSQKLETVKLTELYRQGKDSNIISLAYDIRNKDINRKIFNKDKDLTFIECSDSEVVNEICKISEKYKDKSYKKFQILAPMYKGVGGIDIINNRVKEIFNPKSNRKNENRVGDVVYREKDKVIQLTNMPDDNVYNGDIGLIGTIWKNPTKEIIIDFDSNEVVYTPSNFNDFRLAYAISIHKAQGSEFDIVVLPIIKNYNKMLYQKLIYTAVTRAKKKLYIIGEMDALDFASKNDNKDLRRTTIKEYLINGIK